MGCGCDHVGPRSQALVSVGRPLDSQAGLDMSVSRASRSRGRLVAEVVLCCWGVLQAAPHLHGHP